MPIYQTTIDYNFGTKTGRQISIKKKKLFMGGALNQSFVRMRNKRKIVDFKTNGLYKFFY